MLWITWGLLTGYRQETIKRGQTKPGIIGQQYTVDDGFGIKFRTSGCSDRLKSLWNLQIRMILNDLNEPVSRYRVICVFMSRSRPSVWEQSSCLFKDANRERAVCPSPSAVPSPALCGTLLIMVRGWGRREAVEEPSLLFLVRIRGVQLWDPAVIHRQTRRAG